jgi:hypothetical protein
LPLATNLISIQIYGANELNRLLLEKIVGLEAPDGEPERIPFSRQRYNVDLDAGTMLALGLDDLVNIESWATKPVEERLSNSAVFSRVGKRASGYVRDDHFLRTFDVRKPVKVK